MTDTFKFEIASLVVNNEIFACCKSTADNSGIDDNYFEKIYQGTYTS